MKFQRDGNVTTFGELDAFTNLLYFQDFGMMFLFLVPFHLI